MSETALPKPKLNLLIFICVLLYFTSYLTRINFNASIAEIINSGIITKAQAGAIGTSMFFFYGTGQLISGFLCDKIKPDKIILCGLFFTIVCNIAMPLCGEFRMMAVVWGINGLAQAMFWPPIVKIMARYLPPEYYSKGCLFVSIASHAATVFVYLSVPLCIELMSWKIIFFIASTAALVTAIVWIICFGKIKKALPQNSFALPSAQKNNSEMNITRSVFLSGAFFMLFAIILQGFLKDGFTTWMPVYLTEVFSISSSSAIMLNLALPAVSIACTALASYLYKKLFNQNEAIASAFWFTAALALSVLLIFISKASALWALITAALITGCMHSVNLMLVSFLPARFNSCNKVGAMSGITNACTYIGSSLSSFGLAIIAENYGWQTAIILLTVLAFAGGLACTLSYGKWTLFIKKK